MSPDVVKLAQQAAVEQLQGLEFLSVVELAEEMGIPFTSDEVAQAHILALKARVQVAVDMPPSKKVLLDAVEEVTTDVIQVVRGGDRGE